MDYRESGFSKTFAVIADDGIIALLAAYGVVVVVVIVSDPGGRMTRKEREFD